MSDTFDPALMQRTRIHSVIEILHALPLERIRLKQILIDWSKDVDYPYDHDLFLWLWKTITADEYLRRAQSKSDLDFLFYETAARTQP